MDQEILSYEDFGRRIRNARKALHLTQEELSEQVGISPSFLGHIERGSRKSSVETIMRLCVALKLDAHYLLFGTPASTSNLQPITETVIREYLRMLQNRSADDIAELFYSHLPNPPSKDSEP